MNCNDCFNKTKKHLTERKDFSKQIKELMKNLINEIYSKVTERKKS